MIHLRLTIRFDCFAYDYKSFKLKSLGSPFCLLDFFNVGDLKPVRMHDIKTAKEVSMHEEEDRRAREKIEIAKAKKESLKLAEQEKEIRRLEKSKRKGKTKQVEEDKGKVKPCQDHVEEKDVNPPPR